MRERQRQEALALQQRQEEEARQQALALQQQEEFARQQQDELERLRHRQALAAAQAQEAAQQSAARAAQARQQQESAADDGGDLWDVVGTVAGVAFGCGSGVLRSEAGYQRQLGDAVYGHEFKLKHQWGWGLRR
ncbi:MAG: hypothetical protein IPG06_20610 [Haliea sp.]|nr:hypothetical protein [Haliea sp.]